MRITRLAAIPLLAAVALSCRDGAATAPTARSVAAARHGGATADIVIPAPNGFVSTPLARGSFPDAIDATFRIKEETATNVVHVNDPTQMVMARITFVPGGALPWHSHPGPALVTVTAGELTLVDGDDCGVRVYGAGQSFMDAGQGHVHTAFNAGSVETALYVTYLDVPVGQTPLMPVATAPGC
jgi:quercetin dioxygenase-like cupin family protein